MTSRDRPTAPSDPDATVDATVDVPGTDAPSKSRGNQPSTPERFGRYRVDGTLGRGGMGVVLDAYDPQLRRRVAIKVMKRVEGPHAERARARLLREARAMAQLSHPNVAAVYDAGVHDEQVFLAMERIEGITLSRWNAEHPDPSDRLAALLEAGRGVAAAHDAGMVHRDFKPDNVMVDATGRARVLDFGLVTAAADLPERPAEAEDDEDAPDDDMRLTRAGAVMGTPAYMSPEQMLGVETDARSDQFSFCVTAYEALLGERPFEGTNLFALTAAVTEGRRRPLPPHDLQAELVDAIVRGLEVNPEDRWPDMQALLDAMTPRAAATRVWRWLVPIAIGTGAVAFAAGRLGADETTSSRPACDAGAAAVAETWDAGRAATLTRALGSDERPFVRDAGPWLGERLDTWATRWASAHDAVCRATHHEGSQSAALLDLRTRCLQRGLARVDAALGMLADAEDKSGVRDIPGALPDPSLCQSETPGAVVDALSVEHRAALADAELALARASGLGDAGAPSKGIGALPSVDPDAPWAEAIAPALELARGQMQSDAGEYESSVASLETAYFAALEVSDHRHAAESATALVQTLANRLKDPKRSSGWVKQARAAIGRADDDAELRMRLDSAVGVLEYARSNYADAAKAQRAAHAVAVEIYGEHDARTLTILGNLGNSVGDAGDLAEGERILRRVIEGRKQMLGTAHPEVASALNNLAATISLTGERFDEVEALMVESMEVYVAAFGESHPRVALTLNNLGGLAGLRKDWATASAYFERAHALRLDVLGPDHPDVAMSLANLARVEAYRVPEQAGRHFDQALAVLETELGVDHAFVADVLFDYAHMHQREGHPERARPMLERARRIYARDPTAFERKIARVDELLESNP